MVAIDHEIEAARARQSTGDPWACYETSALLGIRALGYDSVQAARDAAPGDYRPWTAESIIAAIRAVRTDDWSVAVRALCQVALYHGRAGRWPYVYASDAFEALKQAVVDRACDVRLEEGDQWK